MGEKTEYTGHIRYENLTIPSGAAVPVAGFDCGDCRLVGITLPSTFDGTTMTFTSANTFAGTYLTMHNGTADVSLTVAASKTIVFTDVIAQHFKAVRFIKPTAGSSQTSTDTVIVLHLLPKNLGM
jgi:hypothetical protein